MNLGHELVEVSIALSQHNHHNNTMSVFKCIHYIQPRTSGGDEHNNYSIHCQVVIKC